MCAASSVSAGIQYDEIYASQTGSKNILVLVNSDIYSSVNKALSQYISDLEAESYKVSAAKFIDGTAEELKNYIKSCYDNSGIEGVMFIGDLPIAYYCETTQEYYDEYKKKYPFPTDIFYMDLDGQWSDNIFGDGYYDSHTAGSGDIGTEIWLGRLTASTVERSDMDEAGILKNYFDKNKKYRRGELSITKRALFYPDDDWYTSKSYLDKAYLDVTTVSDKSATSYTDYKQRLKDNYEWIHIMAHSTAHEHLFENNWNRLVKYSDVRDTDPKSLFYLLFACTSSAYNTDNYLGGHYIFSKTYGLASLGTTNAGGITMYSYFYPPLGKDQRKTLGEAYKIWFNKEYLSSSRGNLNGITLLGDGTLSLDPPIASIDSAGSGSVNKGESVSFSGSGKINSGSIESYSWRSSLDGDLSSDSSFTTSSLSKGEHTIYFKVKDNNGRWSSEDSATLSVSTLSAPLSLSAEFTSSSGLTLSWEYDSDDTIDGFKIEYRQGSSGSFSSLASVEAGTTSHDTVILNSNSTYYYRVKAYKGSVESEYSNTVSVNTGSNAYNQRLSAPTNLSARAASSSSVVLTWEDNSVNESGFRIERRKEGTEQFTQIASAEGNKETYSDASVEANTKYHYRVKAYKESSESRNSSYSNTATITTPAKDTGIKPKAPSNLRVSTNWDSSLKVGWQDNSSNEDGFELYFWKSGSENSVSKPKYRKNTTFMHMHGLKSKTTYYFKVRAYKGSSASDFSKTASITTK